jgi:hypothetical protein
MKLTHSFARPTSSPIAAPAAASFRFPRVKIQVRRVRDWREKWREKIFKSKYPK